VIVSTVEGQVQGQGQDDLSSSQRSEMGVILRGLQGVLMELDKLLKKFSNLVSTGGGLSFNRLKWGNEDIVRLKNRIVSNTVLLTAFNTTLTK